ncbi:MAG TPA: thiamine-phosphate kinase [Burkholderiales bacterium]|nr:thiamine-phosphate kinase [Burkholderiales bacterium]
MNEFELIRRFFAGPGKGGRTIGDDCARLVPSPGMELSVTADMLVEGRHFLPGVDPRTLGHKALAVNLSDLAASGAAPRWFFLSIALPAADERWLQPFSEGLFALATGHAIELAGGDTTRGPQVVVAITAIGELPAGSALTRGGARAGDDVWVSGPLGGAALALVHPEIASAAQRLHEPQPRVALGQKLRGLASACIDVSDGLAADLGHILERSGVGARVEYERIPKEDSLKDHPDLARRCVLSGGDDYELLFTVPAAKRKDAEALGATRIGEIVAGRDLAILDASGLPIPHQGGFDHFA